MKFKTIINEVNFASKIKTDKDLKDKGLQLLKKYNNKIPINKLSDFELFIFIAIDTWTYGRNFKDSIENAEHHIKNPDRARKIFANIDDKTDGMKNYITKTYNK